MTPHLPEATRQRSSEMSWADILQKYRDDGFHLFYRLSRLSMITVYKFHCSEILRGNILSSASNLLADSFLSYESSVRILTN